MFLFRPAVCNVEVKVEVEKEEIVLQETLKGNVIITNSTQAELDSIRLQFNGYEVRAVKKAARDA